MAATPAGPLTRNTSVIPSLRHTTSTAGSTAPSVRPGIGRHDENDLGDPGDDSRGGQLVGDARVAGLARRYEEAGRGDRGQLLADDEPGLGLEAPVGEAGELVLAEGADVRDGVVDRRVDVRRDGRRLDLGGADAAAASGVERHSVEAGEGVADGVVATLAHVVDQPTDRLAQLWIEDGVEAAPTQRRPRRLVHVHPALRPHHRGHGTRRYRRSLG